MTDDTRQPPPPIDVDSPCMHCGYNLRGLLQDGRCPECGQAIEKSLRGDLLRFSDVRWLAQLRLGASLKLWAIVVTFVLVFATAFTASFGLTPVLTQFAGLVGTSLGLWGTWCITAQEPRIALHDDTLTLRKFIRASAVASAIGGILLLVENAASVPGVVSIVGWILAFAGYGATYGELFYFRRFGNRVPDPGLVKSTKRLIIMSPIYFVVQVLVLFAIGVFTRFATTTPPVGASGTGPTAAGATATSTVSAVPVAPGAAFAVFAGVGVCGGLSFGLILFIWYVRLLTKYKAKFSEAMAQASAASPSSIDDTPDSDRPLPS